MYYRYVCVDGYILHRQRIIEHVCQFRNVSSHRDRGRQKESAAGYS